MDADLLDTLARASYLTHWRAPSPVWENASDRVKEWVREQVIRIIAEYEAQVNDRLR